MKEPDATLGGYVAKHGRPPSFATADGAAYSVEIYVDEEHDGPERFAAALLFVRWSDDGTQPVGHLETDYLAFADTRTDVKAPLEMLTLVQVKEHLDRLVAERQELPDW